MANFRKQGKNVHGEATPAPLATLIRTPRDVYPNRTA
jgi:hypothetical protein